LTAQLYRPGLVERGGRSPGGGEWWGSVDPLMWANLWMMGCELHNIQRWFVPPVQWELVVGRRWGDGGGAA